mmetsp:Transcript_6384/g.20446  ORF Transcript_6384/g.20446 Transcript_6384/m.20446 type:complete len:316 (-) Transcript_6384:143-1090(-)
MQGGVLRLLLLLGAARRSAAADGYGSFVRNTIPDTATRVVGIDAQSGQPAPAPAPQRRGSKDDQKRQEKEAQHAKFKSGELPLCTVSDLECGTCYSASAHTWDVSLVEKRALKDVDPALIIKTISSETPLHIVADPASASKLRLLQEPGAWRQAFNELNPTLPGVASGELDWQFGDTATRWGNMAGSQPHTDGHNDNCQPLFHYQVAGKKRFFFHTHHNTTATRDFKHLVGAGFISDSVYVVDITAGDLLVFVNWLMPHGIEYVEQGSESYSGRLDLKGNFDALRDVWKTDAFHKERCGDVGCTIHPRITRCFTP